MCEGGTVSALENNSANVSRIIFRHTRSITSRTFILTRVRTAIFYTRSRRFSLTHDRRTVTLANAVDTFIEGAITR